VEAAALEAAVRPAQHNKIITALALGLMALLTH
jgi:hypothetical protein